MPGIKKFAGETDEEYRARVGRILDELTDPETKALIDSVTGIIKGDYSLDEVKMEALRKKYGLAG